MKIKKTVFIVIGILVIIGLIGAVGKIYIDKRAEQKEAEQVKVERMSVEALKKDYANIKSVEILESYYEVMTGSYTFIVNMTNQNNQSVRFMYIYGEGSDDLVSSVIEDEEVQVDGVTTDTVRVIYSNKEEDEI